MFPTLSTIHVRWARGYFRFLTTHLWVAAFLGFVLYVFWIYGAVHHSKRENTNARPGLQVVVSLHEKLRHITCAYLWTPDQTLSSCFGKRNRDSQVSEMSSCQVVKVVKVRSQSQKCQYHSTLTVSTRYRSRNTHESCSRVLVVLRDQTWTCLLVITPEALGGS